MQSIFLSAQHMATYYLWQVQVCIANLLSKGISKEQIHVLFATYPNQQLSEEEQSMLHSIQQLATVFFYEDDCQGKSYPSSVRPRIIAKHFSLFPQLENKCIFYHDCDIIFRELPPLFNESLISTWYVSNTADYLDSNYIKTHIGEKGFEEMCRLVKVDPAKVTEQDADCGGAQYAISNVTADFWQKVEGDSEIIYIFLQKANREHYIEKTLTDETFQYGKRIQCWCADMWAMLWNAIYFGYQVKVHPDLNFSWPKYSIENWKENYILHNAGIEQEEAEEYFYKGNYLYHTPFSETFNYVDRRSCSYIYAEAVSEIAKDYKGLSLSDFTFLIPVMIDSDDRLDNLFTSIRYLQKHFETNILILEYGKEQIINPAMLPKKTRLKFVQGDNEIFHRTYFNNQLIDAATTPFISIYDTDVIIPVNQLLEAVDLLRDRQADLVYPYDGSFVSMDKLSSAIFSKFLKCQFFEENREKFIVSSRRSVGGCVLLNRESFIKAGRDNKKFSSWGPEDVERYTRMKILGYKIKRVAGSLYHMHHERGVNSGNKNVQNYIAFIEESSKVFNMKKKELEEYVSNW